jgi:carbonic anhydrase
MQNYYTYDGSLTTPMCYESVRWIVFRDRIGLSRRQVRTDIVIMDF